ncbi:MAG: XRE family transcriptional regulator [Spongiibacteraceae bacterium]
MSDDNENYRSVRPAADNSSRAIRVISAKPPLEDDQNREEIQRMAEFGRLSYAELESLKVIYPGMRQSSVMNAFRELRTKLYQLAGDRDNFVLLITSLTPNGGSTFVTTNLGAAIALDESKTALIVDCNVYDPALHQLLPIEPDFGLVDYLENIMLDTKDVIYSTGVRRLRLIPAGTRQLPGSEFFTSSRMRRLIQELRTRYRDRYILIDSPPIGSSADARILAELCDYVMLVVPHGQVTAEQIQTSIEAIDPEKLAGVIFNS